jgi:hypothetical protein
MEENSSNNNSSNKSEIIISNISFRHFPATKRRNSSNKIIAD